MASSDFDDTRRGTIADIRQLKQEAEIVYRELVLPGWGSQHRHGFNRILYGFVMTCFSFIDLLSSYWRGSLTGQTGRMVAFMNRYVAERPAAHLVAVKMWRHALMHTGNPQPMREERTGRMIVWRLHWSGDQLPRDQHMVLRSDGHLILGMGLIFLIEEIERGAESFFNEASHSALLRENVARTHEMISANRLRLD